MLNFAVLGCGRMGRVHARNIAAHPRAQAGEIGRLEQVVITSRPFAPAPIFIGR